MKPAFHIANPTALRPYGHGLDAWGHARPEARRHRAAFEFLLTCELEMRKLRK